MGKISIKKFSVNIHTHEKNIGGIFQLRCSIGNESNTKKILKTSRNISNCNKMRKGSGLKGITLKTAKETENFEVCRSREHLLNFILPFSSPFSQTIKEKNLQESH